MRGIPSAAEETLASQLGYRSIELAVEENSRKDSSCSDTDFLTSEYYSAAYSTFENLHHNRKLNVNAIQPPSQTNTFRSPLVERCYCSMSQDK